jgi:hypothetical protein
VARQAVTAWPRLLASRQALVQEQLQLRQHALGVLLVGNWARLSAGAGSKGPRLYDWALVRVNSHTGPLGWRRRHQAIAKLCHYRRTNPRLKVQL